MEWINIKEQLPEDGQRVLTWNNRYNDIFLQVYNECYQCWDTEDGDDFDFEVDAILNGSEKLVIEYWCPLPENPYKQKQDL